MNINVLSMLLSQAGRALLSENMIIVVIVLWTVRGSFKKIEIGLSEITKTVKNLNEALLSVETRHADRITGIEQRVTQLEQHNTNITGQITLKTE